MQAQVFTRADCPFKLSLASDGLNGIFIMKEKWTFTKPMNLDLK